MTAWNSLRRKSQATTTTKASDRGVRLRLARVESIIGPQVELDFSPGDQEAQTHSMANAETEESGVDRIGLSVALGGVAAMAALGLAWWQVGGAALHVAFLLSQVVVISIVIWQACDPFAEAAQWIGVKFHLPGSVRGATLDAIASSMPELFSGIFFVLVAIFAAGDSAAALRTAGSNGYGPAVATCAGSAIYNMILIPAICALVISFTRKSRPTIDVAPTVILRDGMWFLGCELLLIVFLFQSQMHWWMAVVLLGLYALYIRTLHADARRFRRALHAVRDHVGGRLADLQTAHVEAALAAGGIRSSRSLVNEVQTRLLDSAVDDEDGDEEEADDKASILFGLFAAPLGSVSAWLVILFATIVAAASCYWLVEVTNSAADALGAPVFFVAVIVAAAASSVPDTFLSIGAARRGDDDGAVSNAFGSNIFDICVCLSIPLLVGCYLSGWQPISLTDSEGNAMPGLVGIRILLCALTVVTLLIMWHNQQLTRRKAYVLCALYGVFVLYAVAGSLGYSLDKLFS